MIGWRCEVTGVLGQVQATLRVDAGGLQVVFPESGGLMHLYIRLDDATKLVLAGALALRDEKRLALCESLLRAFAAGEPVGEMVRAYFADVAT